MNIELLDSLPIAGIHVSVAVAVALLMLAFGEVGYQVGVRAQTRQDKEAPASLGPIVGGLLGMLAFLLAFTFSMASSQYELRKSNVLEEANSIGTAYLRADLIDRQYAIEVKRLLREYVYVRLEAASGSDMDTAIAKSIDIHNVLWAQGLQQRGRIPVQILH